MLLEIEKKVTKLNVRLCLIIKGLEVNDLYYSGLTFIFYLNPKLEIPKLLTVPFYQREKLKISLTSLLSFALRHRFFFLHFFVMVVFFFFSYA
jgi:hypothetical protein